MRVTTKQVMQLCEEVHRLKRLGDHHAKSDDWERETAKPRGCIAPLSAKDVSRIVAMRNKGMALQDIAEATGRHLNTVWTHVSRAVARGECIGGRMMRRTK